MRGLCVLHCKQVGTGLKCWLGGAVSRDESERHADTGAAGGWSAARQAAHHH